MFRKKSDLEKRIELLEQRVSDLEFANEIPNYNQFGYRGGIKLRDAIRLILSKLHLRLEWNAGTPSHYELKKEVTNETIRRGE